MFLNKVADKLVFSFLDKINHGFLEIDTFYGQNYPLVTLKTILEQI